MANALTRTSYKDRLAGIRRAALAKQHVVEAPVVATFAGAAIGLIQKKGFFPVSYMGVPLKPLVLLAGAAVALKSRGAVQKGALELSRAAGTIWGYQAVMSGSLVAGDDDDEM
jgi:hypothetical protein